jgi:response regulator RpfG family c-di-GMP phosphodiesterase
MMKVFYIDDDMEDREVFREIIHSIDPSIDLFLTSSWEGLHELMSSSNTFPDLIFTDYLLVGFTGEDGLIKLKNDPITSHIPLVILSGISDERTVARFKEEGAHAFVKKTGIYIEYREEIKKIVDSLIQ